MPYTVEQIRGWRGVNFAVDPSDVGLEQFVDGVNMEVSDDGTLRGRPGYSQWNTVANVAVMRRFGDSIFYSKVFSGTAANNASYRANLSITTDTTLASGALTDWSSDFASCGVSGNVYSCATNRTLRLLTGGSLGSPIVGTPTGTMMATTPLSDRLVIDGPANPSAPTSHLSFSAPGNGSSWGSTDTLDLAPGDGGVIKAFAVYANELFVFKENRFFVFGPESVDSGGGVVFNYRMVDTGNGCAYPRAAVATPQGVFFVGLDGVYVTTGGPAQKVSDAVQPLFDWNAATDYSLSRVQPSNGAYITYHQGRVWVSFSSTVLVFDPATGTWLCWNFPAGIQSLLGDVPQYATNGQHQIFIGTPTRLAHSIGSETDDAGTAITFSATSGWTDFGSDRTKVIRQAELRGTGSLNLEILADRDYTSSPVAVAFPVLGGSQRADGAWVRKAAKGGEFAYRITSLSGRLDSLDLHLRGARAEGEH